MPVRRGESTALMKMREIKRSSVRTPGRFDVLRSGSLVALATALGAQALAKDQQAASEVGRVFRDCASCPEMIVVPAGAFRMGSTDGEDNEAPVREVAIQSFALGVYEVTFEAWDACAADGFCRSIPTAARRKKGTDHGWGRGRQPVIEVTWSDITGEGAPERGLLAWLNAQVEGTPYRLPSEAEWEYAARAGTKTQFWFGDQIDEAEANFGNSFRGGRPREVGSYSPNGFGLFDMHGNVWEWVADCEHLSHHGAAADGAARAAEGGGNCARAMMRGGAWNSIGVFLRSAFRISGRRNSGHRTLGVRVARDND